MSRTTTVDETKRIHDPVWDDDEWVDIKTYIGSYERDRMTNAGVDVNQDAIVRALEKAQAKTLKATQAQTAAEGTDGEEPDEEEEPEEPASEKSDYQVRVEEQNLARLEVAIVDWFLRDSKTKKPLGRPSRKTIMRLHPEDASFILKEFNAALRASGEIAAGMPKAAVEEVKAERAVFPQDGAQDTGGAKKTRTVSR